MIFLYLCLIFSLKKYNVITDQDSLFIQSGDSLLHLLSPEDGKVVKTRIGYTMELSEISLKKIKKHPQVIHIEEDQEIKLAGYTEDPISFSLQKNSVWGLSKLTGNSFNYEYLNKGGQNVHVYVVDSGIDIHHPEFENRAFFLYNGVEGSPNIDENGHGTHCAGIIGSKTYGVAKQARLNAVKIFDRFGRGSISNLIEGIDFVIEHHLAEIKKANMRKPLFFNLENEINVKENKVNAVVNMSLGGHKSQVLNYMIKHASKHYNIHFSSAAGNEQSDACIFSPASSTIALTIGATDSRNFIARFSNLGECVDLFAPGVRIVSTWPNNGIKTLSGTSMATPHVTGIMAIYLSLAEFTPVELNKRILEDAEQAVKEEWHIPFVSKKKPFASLKQLYERLKFYSRNSIEI